MIVKSSSVEQTDRLAKLVANLVFHGTLILANGDLGAGKTCFAKSLGKYLGVTDTITSPTFNILKCYKGNDYDFYHIDAYRLEGVKQDLGLEEYIEGDGVCFIEWGEYLDYLLPDEYLVMDITLDGETRIFNIEGHGEKYKFIEEEIRRVW